MPRPCLRCGRPCTDRLCVRCARLPIGQLLPRLLQGHEGDLYRALREEAEHASD